MLSRRTLLSSLPAAALVGARAKLPFQKGVNFTAEGRAGYSLESAGPMLEQLQARGVNSIALVPYAFSPKERPEVNFGRGGWERDDDMQKVTARAHQLGMRVLHKPQVWVGRGYPGDLTHSGAALDTWFEQYTAYILHHAKLAAQMSADLFCIGVEFVKLTQHEAKWRGLIAQVRKTYPGPLTYTAAHGPDFQGVRFWDALDYIGLSCYYPLPDNLDASIVVREIESVQKRVKKPVILTEVGFASMPDAHKEPWSESRRNPQVEMQAKCYEALFQAVYNKSWLAGMYWWKVGTNGYGGPSDGSHTPWKKPAMDVMEKWYRKSRT